MSVTFVTFSALQALQGVTLRYIGLKSEFLNSFVSLTAQRNNRNTFVCVRPFNYLAIFKKKE